MMTVTDAVAEPVADVESPVADVESPGYAKGELNELETEDAVIDAMEAQGPAIIVFAMKTCRSCRREEPKVRKLARDNANVPFLRVLFSKATRSSFEKYEVRATPTMILIKPGEERRRVKLDELLTDF